MAATAVIVFGTGIQWGLPIAVTAETVKPWALDAIAPIAPLNEAFYGFSREGNEFVVYPLFHYVVLSAIYAPYLALVWLTGGIADAGSTFPYGIGDIVRFCKDLTILARLVSLVMGLGIVWVVHAITNRLVDNRAAKLAVLATILTAPLAFYSSTSNLDVPYVFWVILAIYQTLLIFENQRTRNYALLGVFAGLSIATKDQAYGFFVLTPFMLAYAIARTHGPSESVSPREYVRSMFSIPMFVGGAACILAFALGNNLLFGGLDGFLRHLSYGGSIYEYRQETEQNFYTLASQLELAGESLVIILQSIGPLSFILSILGVVTAYRERNWCLLSLLTFAISYYLSVVVVFDMVFARYLLLPTILMMPFIGLTVSRSLQFSGVPRVSVLSIAVIGIFWQLALVLNLQLTLVADSRIAMADWIASNVAPGATIESQVRRRFLPHLTQDYDIRIEGNSGDSITMLTIEDKLTESALDSRQPDYILILEDLGITGDPKGWSSPGLTTYYSGLMSGKFGYEVVARFGTPSFVPYQQIPGTRPTSIMLKRINSVD